MKLLLLFFFSALSIAAEPCSQEMNKTKWELWSKGNCLRGANVWQVLNEKAIYGTTLGSGRVGPPFSAKIFRELRRWGANFVTISHPGLYSQTPPYVLDTKIQANLDDLLTKLADANLFAVISFRTGPGRTEKSFDTPPSPKAANLMWSNQKAQDAWVAMWKHTAKRYATHPNVIGFYLMVEPNSNSTVVNEWDPASFATKHGGSLKDWYQLAQRIVPAIREVDAKTPILVSPMNWGDARWLSRMPLMPDNKTVYAIHQYEPSLFTHQAPSEHFTYPGFYDGTWDDIPETIDKNYLAKILQPADDFAKKNGVPVAVMEYGLRHRVPDAVRYLEDEYALFETLRLNHSIWLWESDYSGVDWDDFNFRKATNGLPMAIKNNWSKNVLYKGPVPSEPKAPVRRALTRTR